MPGPIGTYTHHLAAPASKAETHLGADASVRQPDWALFALGPLPQAPTQRLAWQRAAGVLAGYRELAGLPDHQLDLGREPAREQVPHRAYGSAPTGSSRRPLSRASSTR